MGFAETKKKKKKKKKKIINWEMKETIKWYETFLCYGIPGFEKFEGFELINNMKALVMKRELRK